MIKLPEPQQATITQYLATHFPPKPGREPVLVPGPVQITFKEWIAPTLGQRARDPLQLADGTIYWTGQFASVVGRLNPRTGEMKEWKLETEAHPHSIINDRAGNIWYMGNGNGTIGKLNPATGEITIHKMPDPERARSAYADLAEGRHDALLHAAAEQHDRPHEHDDRRDQAGHRADDARPALRHQGQLAGSRVGVLQRIERRRRSRSGDDGHQGVPAAAPEDDGAPPRDHERRHGVVRELRARRARAPQSEDRRGEGMAVTERADTHPYAIEVVDDIIWYNESRRRPDALVRFDPKTEKFQSWAIPSGYGIIRHMRATPDGNLVIHQSSSNRIGLVTINKARDDDQSVDSTSLRGGRALSGPPRRTPGFATRLSSLRFDANHVRLAGAAASVDRVRLVGAGSGKPPRPRLLQREREFAAAPLRLHPSRQKKMKIGFWCVWFVARIGRVQAHVVDGERSAFLLQRGAGRRQDRWGRPSPVAKVLDDDGPQRRGPGVLEPLRDRLAGKLAEVRPPLHDGRGSRGVAPARRRRIVASVSATMAPSWSST